MPPPLSANRSSRCAGPSLKGRVRRDQTVGAGGAERVMLWRMTAASPLLSVDAPVGRGDEPSLKIDTLFRSSARNYTSSDEPLESDMRVLMAAVGALIVTTLSGTAYALNPQPLPPGLHGSGHAASNSVMVHPIRGYGYEPADRCAQLRTRHARAHCLARLHLHPERTPPAQH